MVTGALLRRRERPQPPEQQRSPREPSIPNAHPPADDIDSCWIAGPSGTLHILERHPEGQLPIVFIHGLGGHAEHWAAQFEAAGPAIRAVAFDLPGHGRSDQALDGDYSIQAMAAAIGAVVDALGLRRALLVAHSLGATAAIAYAGTHPERVTGLLMVDPSGDQTRLPATHRQELMAQISKDPDNEIRWNFRQLLTGTQSEVADRVLEDLASVPAEVVVATLEGGISYSPIPVLEHLDCPIRSVISDLNDLPYSLHRLLPDLPVSHVRQSSHWLMMDRPDDLWAVLVAFLDEIQQPMMNPAG